jgi:superfamily II DNA or RNA helicase
MTETVVLSRSDRIVVATGEPGKALPAKASDWLRDKLTYYEKKFNYEALGYGENPTELYERQLYYFDSRTGALLFPIGLMSRVSLGLKQEGFKVVRTGKTLTETDPTIAALDWDGLFADFTIYPGQDTCLARIIAAEAGGVISATTGAGKSVVIRMICRLFSKAKIHVVTKYATLADEIYRDIAAVIPDVGFCGGGKKKIRRVTVFVADSLHHGQGDASIVLADEVHELAAPKYTSLLGLYTKARFFGFSATPTGRMDGRDAEIEALFGPVLYTISYQEAQAMGRVVPITVEWLRVPDGPDVSSIRNPHIREKYGIWQNSVRNRILADRLTLFGDDEQVLVMVKTIEHAVMLRQLLPDYTLCYASNGMDADRLDKLVAQGLLPEDEPRMTPARQTNLRKMFAENKLKKVIANMVWSTGVNFRNLAVLARADAMASEIRDGQIPGRVCRRIEGIKESALLIDMHDDWSPGYFRKAQARKSNYKKRGWVQTFWQQ